MQLHLSSFSLVCGLREFIRPAGPHGWGTLACLHACMCLWNCVCISEGMDSPLGLFLSVGLGLIFLGTRDAAEGALCAVAALPHAAFSAAATRVIEGLAAAGSGDVLKVQRMLGVCAESRPEGYWKQKQKELQNEQQGQDGDPAAAAADSAATRADGAATAGAAQNGTSTSAADDDEDHPDDTDQAVAVLNIALIAFAEETGAEMALRLYVGLTLADVLLPP